MDFKSVLNDLKAQRDQLDRAISSLYELTIQHQALHGLDGSAPVRRGRRRRKMSAAGRARIAAAQRRRWAKIRGK